MRTKTERKNQIGRIICLAAVMILVFALTALADVPGAAKLRKAKPGSKQAKLLWSTVSGAKGYKIYRVKKSGSKKLVGTVKSGSTKSVVIKKLRNGYTYNFAVAAFNNDGEGALSNVLEVTPQFTDPGPMREARLYANKNRAVILRWGANAKATGYQILVENAEGKVVPAATVASSVQKLKIKGLKNGKVYKFYIRAVVKKGSQTAYGAMCKAILGRPISNKKLKAAVGNIHPYYYKAKTLAKLSGDGFTIPQGKTVTIIKKTSGKSTVTYDGKTFKVPTSALEIVDFITKWEDAPSKSEAEAFVNAKGYQSESKYLIWINTYTQHMYIFQGTQYNWKLVKDWRCATGNVGYPTPLAVSQIHYKKVVWFFNKEEAEATGQSIQCGYWACRIKGGAIHSWLYNWSEEKKQTGKDPDGYPANESQHRFYWTKPGYGYPKSHGCVRVRLEFAKWIYDTVPIDTTNVTY